MALHSTKETSAITHRQKFEGHTGSIWGAIHLPGGQRIITCSGDGSLRVWNVKSGKQIGEDWRDGDSRVWSIALSPDGKKVVSGSSDGAVRLWDIDTCKVTVESVCWSRDGRRVLSGSQDGTARQWEVESGETIENILASIETGHKQVYAVVDVMSPGWVGSSIKIWDAKTGKLVATLGHRTDEVSCLAWTKDGKTLISGSLDTSIRTWNTTNWKQIAVLDEHNDAVRAIAISPNDRILASASYDRTARLWNLDSGQPICSPIQHADEVNCVSFSAGGMQLATGCDDKNAYIWDVAAIIREVDLDDLLSDQKANAARPPNEVCPSVNRVPQGFFDGVPPSHSSARSHPRSPALPGSILLSRLFSHSPSDAHHTSPSSPLDWARNLLNPRRQSGEQIELHGRSPPVVEVPYAKGKRRNASAGERRKRPLPWQNAAASGSRPHKPNATQQSGTATQTQPSLQPQPATSNWSTTPAVGDNAAATSSTPSQPDVVLRHARLWTRFWLFIGCLSPEYRDGHH
ncbi:WD40 repeat-like protein [Suillus brevipes Sb2]|nr:WD40 repeat-like protein [Suillus brevipes Sb2]